MLRFSNYTCHVIWNPDIVISMLGTRHCLMLILGEGFLQASRVLWKYTQFIGTMEWGRGFLMSP